MNATDDEARSIWKTPATLEGLNALHEGTMGEATGMHFSEIGPDYLEMTMPVDERTRQPLGMLHGGASAALAETIGSVASTLCLDSEKAYPVGVELNCSHLRGVRDGTVTARCEPVRIGRTLHVWQIHVRDERQKLVCVSRLTVAIVTRKA